LEIINRKENALLNRVEIEFTLNHDSEPTPSLSEMISLVLKLEPGSKKELVYIKNVNTRFGMPQTSGLALIYASEESTSTEPDYIKTRHKVPEESTGGN
jgi:ribosomal protein S24E|tara:strand:- start:946 stop:1242 length:297 start_codon:yes stop_codon:yes gene_type:complete